MAEEKQYYLKVKGNRINVSQEVFKESEYYRRKERTQKEAMRVHGLMSIDAFDTESLAGMERLCDPAAPSTEDQVLMKMDIERLSNALRTLSQKEFEVIQAIFFEGKSEHGFSRETGIPQKTINYRKHKALEKLRKFLEE